MIAGLVWKVFFQLWEMHKAEVMAETMVREMVEIDMMMEDPEMTMTMIG